MNREVELMHALADGELAPGEEAEARQLLESNDQLRAEYEWARAMKSSLGAHCRPVENDEAWSRCIGRLDDVDRVKSTESFVGRWAWVFCGALLLMIVAGGTVSRVLGSRTVSNTQIAGLLDPSGALPRGEAPRVKALDYVDLSEFQRTSVSGGYLDSRPFLRYGLRDKYGLGGLALLMIQGADRIEGLDTATSNPNIKSGTLNNTKCVSWSVQGNTCILFGERDTQELTAYAESMMR